MISFFLENYALIKEYKQERILLEKAKSQPSTWKIESVIPNYPLYILVIGESMRLDYLSVYGFPLNTTPFLDKSNGTFYHGYISAAPNTQPSLLRTLYQLDKNNKIIAQNNLISLAKDAGFKTYWLSNQGMVGEYDNAASRVGRQADFSFFTKKGDYKFKNTFDTELLPHFKQIINEPSNKPKLIVLHLIGSHPIFCERLWQKVEFSYINENLSCYLQSIKQTDWLLENIVEELKLQNKKYSLLYFSDHGLSLQNKSRLGKLTLSVGNETKQNYLVPLFILASDAKEHQIIPIKQSAINFLYGFSQWLGITLIDKSLIQSSFWQGSTDPIKVYDWNNWVEFDLLKNEPAIKP
ncbi:phosphoethanolamine transferase [Avibacterium paragallinarum]|uniref:Hydrolase, inner membrane n=2 Tax=Avibacterium paragallinarum TaxID=728 RepID=A0A380Z6Y8_AVIPA|nr:phosphoethanolamine transferase [Avibacterium paragallinarum]POY46638.1 hypothetical protein C3364_06235 [Avibacterium paragallinarum]RZN59398.1 phosphoethanolamine transferase [Avibacterium paragallinarum]RZN76348.1 phosphoethanolamine transferase [Avibacterium paragallinarum]CDF98231.1 Putative Arylsulfatase [Avibacterium paragallinarum JF4211]STO70308.1 hydrolase, inner membrane [Avibacterium paragallinarum]